MDEYVMMRLAQMVYEGVVEAAIDRCTDPDGRGGNFGGMMLTANANKLKQALGGLEMSPAPPYDWTEFKSSANTENDGKTDA